MGRARTTLLVLLFLLGTSHGIRAPDCDNDGVPDDEDEDDDNDGIVDEGEPCGDSDGDGILNKDDPDYNEAQFEDSDDDGDGESEEAPDCDGDGVPDDEDVSSILYIDDDNDGIVDKEEPCADYDGDGILNMNDPDYNEAHFEDYDGEGVWGLDSYNFDEGALSADCEDYGDCDEDSDGTDDEMHIEEDSGKGQGDFDQDGIPDFLDSDDDNDGVPDEMDNDDDNDGIIDEEDPDHNDGVPALTAGPQNVEITPACDDTNCWIRVDWTPPPRGAWMSCLLGYRVGIRRWRVGHVGGMEWYTTDWIWKNDRGTHHDLRLNKFFFYEEPKGTNHSLTLRDLDHGTTYIVNILTFNPKGGVHEESHEVDTPSGWCRIA